MHHIDTLVRLPSNDKDKLLDSSTFSTDWDTAATCQVSASSSHTIGYISGT